ncbi:methionyl aminopeptidase [Anaerorhabdus sp.]|uniref:methionyl aminopeptidase n=1 Tax=Anaerorhabdus sp. TaxID=1872524 RepID=UPI002B2133D3|nr:methionyl aminopeptidase [Anaerorhabdus sp.]MEA4874598.1 methionyl aminopeptidase [Anaerorhabdus sp.]
MEEIKCWCGSGKSYEECHKAIDDKIKQYEAKGVEVPPRSLIKTPEQIEKIRKSAKINTQVLDLVEKNIHEGMSTEEIDVLVKEFTASQGAICAPYQYQGFPKSVCTSINEEVCHGIPSRIRKLKNGDIVNVDVSTILDGYYSDASRMFCIGEVDEEKKKLVEVTKECLRRGIEAAQPWGFVGDIGAVISEYAREMGYSVVRELGGHGVGIEFHEDPFISHVGKKGTGMLLVPGMIFTIEPMINVGKANVVIDRYNGWTIYTGDGKPSAQVEHMILITEDGPEILTY